jgi:hypothetical protein
VSRHGIRITSRSHPPRLFYFCPLSRCDVSASQAGFASFHESIAQFMTYILIFVRVFLLFFTFWRYHLKGFLLSTRKELVGVTLSEFSTR